jgi:pimeloyl-ACP methyl ester carboxylesterase
LVILSALPASGQEWLGEARVRGVVLDADGEPLAGARVALTVYERDEGPPAVTTGAEGEWSIPRLAPGLYDIRVEGPGHLPAEGWVRVPEAGTSTPMGELVRVEMQSLDIVTPRFAEGDPAGSVRRWLDVGDAHLAQERPAEARGEYLKALATPGVLAPAARGELLSTIARTHFLEGDAEAAERALRAALAVAPAGSPEAERTRQVYGALLELAGRGDEAASFLERLARERDAVAAELVDLVAPWDAPAPAPSGAASTGPPDRPVLDPEPGRTGRYRTAFRDGESDPLARPELFLERHGIDRAGAARSLPGGPGGPGRLGYDLAEETFEVHVPESYEPGAGWGLLVWVSPTPSGGTERAEVQAALEGAKLIWIGANRSGNGRPTWDRGGLAVDAARRMTALYDLDPERIYVAGYSGGGRVASGMALLYPELFRGSLSVFGVSWYEPVPVSDKPGAHWPAAFAAPPPESLPRLRAESRFVLLTGSRDFNKPQTRAIRRAMEEAGFEQVTYVEVPGASHYDTPEGEWWAKAFAALDAM